MTTLTIATALAVAAYVAVLAIAAQRATWEDESANDPVGIRTRNTNRDALFASVLILAVVALATVLLTALVVAS